MYLKLISLDIFVEDNISVIIKFEIDFGFRWNIKVMKYSKVVDIYLLLIIYMGNSEINRFKLNCSLIIMI